MKTKILVEFRICISVPLTFLMRKTLTDDFWGLHKTINCTFPLKISFIIKLYKKLERENEIPYRIFVKYRIF